MTFALKIVILHDSPLSISQNFLPSDVIHTKAVSHSLTCNFNDGSVEQIQLQHIEVIMTPWFFLHATRYASNVVSFLIVLPVHVNSDFLFHCLGTSKTTIRLF